MRIKTIEELYQKASDANQRVLDVGCLVAPDNLVIETLQQLRDEIDGLIVALHDDPKRRKA